MATNEHYCEDCKISWFNNHDAIKCPNKKCNSENIITTNDEDFSFEIEDIILDDLENDYE